MSKRIAVLCSDDAHHKYLVALLRSRFDVAAVVVEPARCQRRRLRRSSRRRDYAYALYHHLRRTVLGLNRYRRRHFADLAGAPADVFDGALTVEDINDPAVAELLEGLKPDLTVIICTSILKERVLAAAGPMVVNVHGGYLPYYRGNHCFFFALYQNELDRIGSTIHFVNAGIDTGDIIEVVVPRIDPWDNAEALYCRAERLAIDRLAELLERWQQSESLPRHPQTVRGRLYLTRDRKPHHDLILWLRRWRARLFGRAARPTAEAPRREQVTRSDPGRL
ncbi:MAG TPA: formyl transferase [Pyrinomonadaceae bacterium]|jgi:methionyl-tRNA formyltransferase